LRNSNGTLTNDVTRLEVKVARTTASCIGLWYVDVAMLRIAKKAR
jgi:hypothetical protein